MPFNVTIHNDKPLKLKELKSGDLYITRTAVNHPPRLRTIHTVRRRTDTPYWSETYYGTRVASFPSTTVFLVDVVDTPDP